MKKKYVSKRIEYFLSTYKKISDMSLMWKLILFNKPVMGFWTRICDVRNSVTFEGRWRSLQIIDDTLVCSGKTQRWYHRLFRFSCKRTYSNVWIADALYFRWKREELFTSAFIFIWFIMGCVKILPKISVFTDLLVF